MSDFFSFFFGRRILYYFLLGEAEVRLQTAADVENTLKFDKQMVGER